MSPIKTQGFGMLELSLGIDVLFLVWWPGNLVTASTSPSRGQVCETRHFKCIICWLFPISALPVELWSELDQRRAYLSLPLGVLLLLHLRRFRAPSCSTAYLWFNQLYFLLVGWSFQNRKTRNVALEQQPPPPSLHIWPNTWMRTWFGLLSNLIAFSKFLSLFRSGNRGVFVALARFHLTGLRASMDYVQAIIDLALLEYFIINKWAGVSIQVVETKLNARTWVAAGKQEKAGQNHANFNSIRQAFIADKKQLTPQEIYNLFSGGTK